MEPRGLLPCSQELTTGPSPKPGESSPYSPTVLLKILPSLLRSFKWSLPVEELDTEIIELGMQKRWVKRNILILHHFLSDDWSLIPGRVGLFSLPQGTDWLWGPPGLLSNGY
jgi:hypothetical protein